MFKIGAGYQPMNFVKGPRALPLPAQVALVEAGPAEFDRADAELSPDVSLSLHLARTPIAEGAVAQDNYVSFVKSKISSTRRPVSIGLHLTNERDSGIGRYGFSSHYVADEEREERVCRFIRAIATATGLPVWLENANFYSESPSEVLSSWASYTRILERSGAHAIIDLSHLFIDAFNTGLRPDWVLGAVPWGRVAEFHLSGIVRGTDGSLHDGHSRPVAEEVWRLVGSVIESGLCPRSDLYFTIEHTDPEWESDPGRYRTDFERLKRMLLDTASGPERRSSAGQADRYARSYLLRTILRQVPKLKPACEQRGLSVSALCDEWLALDRLRDTRLLLVAGEVSESDPGHPVVAAEDFLLFVKQKMVAHESRC